MAPEVRPIMSQASQTGIMVLRYFSCPMRRKRAADPINEITSANKTLTIIPVIRSFWRRFLRAVVVSCTYSLRMSFISLSKA